MNHTNSRHAFTLIETIIAIGLFSILVAIGVGGFTTALRSQREAGALLGAQSNVSAAVEQMAREIRTGYLFCHVPGDNSSDNISPACQPCNITYSTYADPNAPVVLNSNPAGNSDLPIWTCNALQFYNSNSAKVTYYVDNGMLMRQDSSENNDTPEAITNGNVTIKYFDVTMFGNTEGDNWTPRITVALGIAPSSTDPTLQNNILNLQTTISARLIDCTTGSPPQC
jgi:prepilin-type N-terminal cleavage/methylation domain-containing protein